MHSTELIAQLAATITSGHNHKPADAVAIAVEILKESEIAAGALADTATGELEYVAPTEKGGK